MRCFLLLALLAPACAYRPTQSDVDAFATNLNKWPVTDPSLKEWANLMADVPEYQFCRNGDCTLGLKKVQESFTMFGGALSFFDYKVKKWHSAEGILWLEDTVETMTSKGGCKYSENVPRVMYYNEAGKITSIHQYILPFNLAEAFLYAAGTGMTCEGPSFVAPPITAPPINVPTQANLDAFVKALTTWPKDDPKLEAWKALWADGPNAQFCRNGGCIYGLEAIAGSFVQFGGMMHPNLNAGYEVKKWESAGLPNAAALWMYDTVETLVSAGNCKYAENVPRLIYYNENMKIVQLHQLILPDAALNAWLMDTMGGKKCVCAAEEYFSPNTNKCLPRKTLGQRCNRVQLCAGGHECVNAICAATCPSVASFCGSGTHPHKAHCSAKSNFPGLWYLYPEGQAPAGCKGNKAGDEVAIECCKGGSWEGVTDVQLLEAGCTTDVGSDWTQGMTCADGVWTLGDGCAKDCAAGSCGTTIVSKPNKCYYTEPTAGFEWFFYQNPLARC